MFGLITSYTGNDKDLSYYMHVDMYKRKDKFEIYRFV